MKGSARVGKDAGEGLNGASEPAHWAQQPLPQQAIQSILEDLQGVYFVIAQAVPLTQSLGVFMQNLCTNA